MDPFCLSHWIARYAGDQGLIDPINPIWIDQVVVDSRSVSLKSLNSPEGPSRSCLFVALKGQSTDGHAFLRDAAERGARYAIVQKGFQPPSSPLPATLTLIYVEEPLRALQQIACAYRQEKAVKLVAVTGSRGKTLMKDLLVHLLTPLSPSSHGIYGSPESFNSQVGVALSLLRMRQMHSIAVIEAGISEPGEMTHLAQMLHPDMALLLNLSPEPGSSLNSLDLLAREKMELLMRVPKKGSVFLPCLPCLQPYYTSLNAQIYSWMDPSIPISVMPTAKPHHYQVSLPGIDQPFQMALPASYWAQLLSQALCVAFQLGVPSNQLVDQLRTFTPESMETHIWRTTQGVTLINSPYCADPQSIASTMLHLKQAPPAAKRFFFLHGVRAPYDMQATLAYLEHAVEKKQVDKVLLCGLEATEKEGSVPAGMVRVQDVQEGLNYLARHAQHGDHIACKGSYQLSLETITQAFQDRTPYNVCRIDLSRIAHNIALMLNQLGPSAQLMVMVKALAYGTEAVRMAHFLSECGIRFLGVSFVDEGVALKQAGVTQVVFSLYVAPQEVEKAVRFGLHAAVDSIEMIRALQAEAALQEKKVSVHLHVDTGMRRLGCCPKKALLLAKEIACSPHLVFEGLFSHFVAADMPEEDAFTEEQFRTLQMIYQTLIEDGITPTFMHMGCSASLARLPHLVGNMVRIGLGLYGLDGGGGLPALSLHSQIIGLHDCLQGESVGYGRRYRATKDEKIAVVPLGYFDGIPRNWSGKVSLQVRGVRVPIVGPVCMDYLMLDVTAVCDVEIGDPVLIFGEDGHGGVQSFKELAQEGDSIVHALLAQIGPRIPRIFLWNT